MAAPAGERELNATETRLFHAAMRLIEYIARRGQQTAHDWGHYAALGWRLFNLSPRRWVVDDSANAIDTAQNMYGWAATDHGYVGGTLEGVGLGTMKIRFWSQTLGRAGAAYNPAVSPLFQQRQAFADLAWLAAIMCHEMAHYDAWAETFVNEQRGYEIQCSFLLEAYHDACLRAGGRRAADKDWNVASTGGAFGDLAHWQAQFVLNVGDSEAEGAKSQTGVCGCLALNFTGFKGRSLASDCQCPKCTARRHPAAAPVR